MDTLPLLRRLRARHLAPLIVFFTMGLSALDSVSQTFFVRDHVHLSAAQLIEITIWTQLPWSVKIFFGSVIDSFRLFRRDNRGSYIYLGAFLMALGQALFATFTAGLSPIHSEYGNLLISGLLTTVGIVFAQSTANTLAVELVEREDLGYMQVGTRLAFSMGALLAALLTGHLASRYDITNIAMGKLILPAILATGTIISLRGTTLGRDPLSIQWRGLGISVAFAAFCLLTRSQVAIFLGQMLVVNYLLWRLSRSMAIPVAKTFLLSCLAIFFFRVSPDVGPGFSWWITGAIGNGGLAFDPEYLGHLRLVSTVVDVLALSLLAGTMARGRILQSLGTLTIVGTVTALPALAVYYGLHHYIGVHARTIFFVDTAVSAPLGDLSMIPLGILIARAAPAEGRAMYMAVTASFMNMALLGGDLMTRGLNVLYIVTRTDYTELGHLLLSTTAIGLILSVVGLAILYYTERGRA